MWKIQKKEMGVHSTISQVMNLSLYCKNVLTVESWFFRFTVIWAIILGYFPRKKEVWKPTFKVHISVSLLRWTELPMAPDAFPRPWSCGILYNFQIAFMVIISSWNCLKTMRLTHGREHYCHFGENSYTEFSWLTEGHNLHFDINLHCFAFIKCKNHLPPELSRLDL